MQDSKGERIAKVIARAGVCSRRDAERLIASGQVVLNGKKLDTPATLVTDADTIEVNGKPLPQKQSTRLFLYHKPEGLVTTARDEKGRDTVFGALPKDLPRVVSVGRLDLNTEGLLLLTNDGELSRYLELPANGWVRNYRVRAFGNVTQKQLDGLKNGTTIDGVKYGEIKAKFESQKGSNVWLTVSLKEGKNREVRRVLESLGLQVNRLIRTSYGAFQLGPLEKGSVVEVPEDALKKHIAGFFQS
ncbi:MAG: pseudouridine synthase [Pseudomonadota bacterium]